MSENNPAHTRTVVSLVLFMLVTGIGVSGLLPASKTLSSSGSIKAINVRVYSDPACTKSLSSLNWGNPKPGDVVTKIVYIKNFGKDDMILHLTTDKWYPTSAPNYLTITWDNEYTTLSADEITTAVITLTVSKSITKIYYFSFQTIIEGIG